METTKKIDIEVASLKTLLESLKLDTIRYLAGKGLELNGKGQWGHISRLVYSIPIFIDSLLIVGPLEQNKGHDFCSNEKH